MIEQQLFYCLDCKTDMLSREGIDKHCKYYKHTYARKDSGIQVNYPTAQTASQNPFDDPKTVAAYNEVNNKMVEIVEELEHKINIYEAKIALLEAKAAYEQRMRMFYETEEGATIILLKCNFFAKMEEYTKLTSIGETNVNSINSTA